MSNYKHPNLWRGCIGAWAPSQQSPGGLTLFDQSRNSNNAILTSMDPATDWVMDGGHALELDGVDDYVSVSDNDSLDFGTGDFSVTVWVKTATNGFNSIVTKGNHSTDAGWSMDQLSSGGIRFIFLDQASYGVDDVGDISDGVWHFLVGLRKSGTVYLYIDGELAGSDTGNTHDVSSSEPLRISGRGGSSLMPIDGLLDDIRIYDRALSSTEIRQLYNGGQRGAAYEKKRRVISSIPSEVKAPPAVRRDGGSRWRYPNLWDGCVGAWSPSQQSPGGLTLFDQTNHRNDGTLTNMDPATDWVMDEGNALDYDGTNDYVSIASSPELEVQEHTVSTWIYTDLSENAWFSKEYITSDGFVWGCLPQYGRLIMSFAYYDGSIRGYYLPPLAGEGTTTSIPLNEWIHIAGTWSPQRGTVEFFTNGVLVGSTATASDEIIHDSSRVLRIGGREYSSSSTLDGFLDDTRLYNRILSPQEIRQLSGSGPKKIVGYGVAGAGGGQRGAAYQRGSKLLTAPTAVTTASTVPYYYNSLLTGSGV